MNWGCPNFLSPDTDIPKLRETEFALLFYKLKMYITLPHCEELMGII